MTIDEICSACITALRAEGYNDSTIFNYEGVIRRLNSFVMKKALMCILAK